MRSFFNTSGNVLPISLMASALVGFLAVMSLIALPFTADVATDMRLSPASKTLILGETFTVDVIVQSEVPVNVFAGELTFDNESLEVQSIDYNTSIADLWAEEPWYSNGDGTLTFIGGTTRRGGFQDTGTLLTITFKTLRIGPGSLAIKNAQVLKHDGFGTNAPLVAPIDAIFTVEAEPAQAPTNLLQKTAVPSTYAVVPTPPTTDLNGDGKQSIADMSIFLLNMNGGDSRFDFNMDGKVSLIDFNILLGS